MKLPAARFLGALCYLLLASNLLFLLWHQLRPVSEPERTGVLPGLAAPLVLISELTSAPQARACYLVGPFLQEESARVAMTSSGLPFALFSRREPVPDSVLYRALLPAASSRELALARLAEVAMVIERLGGGIDTYLVTSGPLINAISLGLFSEHRNALNVQSSLAAEDIHVVIETESVLQTRHWAVVESGQGIDFAGSNLFFEGVEVRLSESSENLCEMIAQAD